MRTTRFFAVAALIAACGSSNTAAPTPLDGGAQDLAAQRRACTFATGARVRDTLGFDDAARAKMPIKNVVVLMKENRSFDHVLGKLQSVQPSAEALPATFTNKDRSGADVAFTHATSTCFGHDPDHQWISMHAQVDGGKMDGFVESAAFTTGTDGHFAMTYYDANDLPFYYWLASTYALDDRHFASVRSGTFPNRNFLLLGTADGVSSTGAGFPDPTTPTIFDALDAAHVTWGVYSDGSLLSGTLDWKAGHRGAHPFADFVAALDAGTLPQVAFVDGVDDVEDEHPSADVQRGEAWTRDIYTHAVKSPLWPGLAMLWTYDEAGGFADHVPPPNDACVARDNPRDTAFHELGVRVPFVAISPYARPRWVSHVVEEHTAMTRFIEVVFDLPALTARDANSDGLLDLFDFGSAAMLHPPDPPAAGTGGCTGVVLTANKPNYASGEAITIGWTGGLGGANDKIAIYTYTANGPTKPGPGAIAWAYLGGGHTASTAPKSGTVTIDAGAVDAGPWPLPVGGYIAYYLPNDGYAAAASIDFNVH